MLKADGLDDAILGQTTVTREGGEVDVLAYSVGKILLVLMERDSMSRGEATEFFDFNIAGAWMGNETPIYIYEYYDAT
jgi:hypothetical protein